MYIKLTKVHVNDPAYALVRCGFEVADEFMGTADVSYKGAVVGTISEPELGEYELTLNMERLPMDEACVLLMAINNDRF